MIYIPLDVRLRMIQEDLKEIKESLSSRSVSWLCPDCGDIACTAARCQFDKPEFGMRIMIPID